LAPRLSRLARCCSQLEKIVFFGEIELTGLSGLAGGFHPIDCIRLVCERLLDVRNQVLGIISAIIISSPFL
jgi:hypothetical protein